MSIEVGVQFLFEKTCFATVFRYYLTKPGSVGMLDHHLKDCSYFVWAYFLMKSRMYVHFSRRHVQSYFSGVKIDRNSPINQYEVHLYIIDELQ